MRRAIIFAMLLLFPAIAMAQMPSALQPPPPFLGRDLAGLCREADGSAGQTGCLRYLQAAVAMYELVLTEGRDNAWFCAPRDVPPATLRKQFLEFVGEATDQELGKEAIQLVRQAFTDAFPCQE
ncbi:Rap1a/Tai family immunity protein [Ferrovibrio sp.]|uniref:Rap1a/Tai family immunity protein n=1 Tax=Ferrovibrio sp. TaxID=1917215 RepID=UPI0035B312DA